MIIFMRFPKSKGFFQLYFQNLKVENTRNLNENTVRWHQFASPSPNLADGVMMENGLGPAAKAGP